MWPGVLGVLGLHDQRMLRLLGARDGAVELSHLARAVPVTIAVAIAVAIAIAIAVAIAIAIAVAVATTRAGRSSTAGPPSRERAVMGYPVYFRPDSRPNRHTQGLVPHFRRWGLPRPFGYIGFRVSSFLGRRSHGRQRCLPYALRVPISGPSQSQRERQETTAAST